MKGNAKKILILEILFILFASVIIFTGTKLNIYLLSLILFTLFGASVYFVSFKKISFSSQKKAIISVALITISIIIITYAIGFICGYVRSPYSKNIITMFLNVFPAISVIIPAELFRYQCCRDNNKYNIILSVIALIFADILFSMSFYTFDNNFVLLQFVCVVILPSISKNVVLSIFSNKYGYWVSLIYPLIVGTYEYIVPIMPAYDEYLTSIISIVMPIINLQFIKFYLRKREKKDIREKGTGSKIFVALCVLFLLFVIGIYSNLFRYWVATIASGSMSPTIDVGDIVVIDKWYAENPGGLKKGDILVFKIRNTLYTHRIINITEKNNNYYIRTKGDYKDNAEDSWVVVKTDIIGKVNFKIKYLGLPSVWLHRLLAKGE